MLSGCRNLRDRYVFSVDGCVAWGPRSVFEEKIFEAGELNTLATASKYYIKLQDMFLNTCMSQATRKPLS
jgi:hypothetical protein